MSDLKILRECIQDIKKQVMQSPYGDYEEGRNKGLLEAISIINNNVEHELNHD